MIKLEGLRLPPGGGGADLRVQAARLLRLRPEDIRDLRVLRRSVDAREDVAVIYTVCVAVDNEAAVLRRCRGKKASRLKPEPGYRVPLSAPRFPPEIRPVVVGAGPAGLFAALVLALAGQRPILLERGRPVEARKADVERFWSTGELDLASNVQFAVGESPGTVSS